MKHAIQFTTRNQLEDLHFADDLNLLSHTHEQMQVRTTSLATAASESMGLNIHKGKSKISSTTWNAPIPFHLMKKLCKMWNHSRTLSAASSMNIEDLMQK
ncbi:unnamed protein product [Schistosoma mattheei]|uniref:Uncharacterized protein n=1 Tax=Schistosoma mattheei TaxID=31246 RepID=A0A183NR05_9TREM|nr:unnamed protein product [Schistosoma mattheei]